MIYSVTLPQNTEFKIGSVFLAEDELWMGYSGAFKAFCGPFGTRYDAELEVLDMWERAAYTNWNWRIR